MSLWVKTWVGLKRANQRRTGKIWELVSIKAWLPQTASNGFCLMWAPGERWRRRLFPRSWEAETSAVGNSGVSPGTAQPGSEDGNFPTSCHRGATSTNPAPNSKDLLKDLPPGPIKILSWHPSVVWKGIQIIHVPAIVIFSNNRIQLSKDYFKQGPSQGPWSRVRRNHPPGKCSKSH